MCKPCIACTNARTALLEINCSNIKSVLHINNISWGLFRLHGQTSGVSEKNHIFSLIYQSCWFFDKNSFPQLIDKRYYTIRGALKLLIHFQLHIKKLKIHVCSCENSVRMIALAVGWFVYLFVLVDFLEQDLQIFLFDVVFRKLPSEPPTLTCFYARNTVSFFLIYSSSSLLNCHACVKYCVFLP